MDDVLGEFCRIGEFCRGMTAYKEREREKRTLMYTYIKITPFPHSLFKPHCIWWELKGKGGGA